MDINNSPLILINKTCQAKCSHCPYANNQNTDPIPLDFLLSLIKDNPHNFLILSGGEPFEYPFFSELLNSLKSIQKYFRIATGGHFSIKPYVEQLINLKFFTGISLGTDLLIPNRNSKKGLISQWINNLRVMKEFNIHYSLTITLGKDINMNELIDILINFNCNPGFFMLSEMEGEIISSDEWKRYLAILKSYFPHQALNVGFKN